jgi:hypothetical protein
MIEIEIHPNLIAYFALLIWPAVTIYLYSLFPVGQATLLAILGGYLLLPVGTQIKFPMVPALDKNSIPSIAALIGCALYSGGMPKFFRGFRFVELLILMIPVGCFATSMFNNDPIQIGEIFLPGVGAYDAGSATIAEFIFILPFFLGRQFLRDAEHNAEILRTLVIAGLVYSLPMLFEIRLSPQLHTWIYGYFPHAFIQQIRYGGFRPVVFVGHGLLVAFFAMTTTVAAAACWRTRTRIWRMVPSGITAYLAFVVLLCKTGSALLYTAVLVPLVRVASPRWQVRVACVLTAIALTYPLLRVTSVFPTALLLEISASVNTDREESLKTRFDQEEQLLNHAWQRVWFGWGRFGRNRVFDVQSGRDVSITDGYWIITLGTFGLVGFIARFGLLSIAVFRAAGALKYAQSIREKEYLSALALIVAINIVDLLPNSTISPWTWLLVGALLGRAEALRGAGRQRIPLGSARLASMRTQRSHPVERPAQMVRRSMNERG